MCATGMSACSASRSKSASMSAYQKMPLPSQLTARKSCSTLRCRDAALRVRHKRSSARCRRESVTLTGSNIAEHGLEIAHDALPPDGLATGARRASEAACERQVAGEAHRGGREGTLV